MRGKTVPWHWHKAELFYMEQGSLEYDTPHGKTVLRLAQGLVNSNVLHMSRAKEGKVQSPHFFISLTRC